MSASPDLVHTSLWFSTRFTICWDFGPEGHGMKAQVTLSSAQDAPSSCNMPDANQCYRPTCRYGRFKPEIDQRASPPLRFLKSNACPLPPHQKFHRPAASSEGVHQGRRSMASLMSTDSLPGRMQYFNFSWRFATICMVAWAHGCMGAWAHGRMGAWAHDA